MMQKTAHDRNISIQLTLICNMDGLSVIKDLLLPGTVAFSAIVTAWYTRNLIIETKMMRLSQYEPNIGVYVDDNYELEPYRNIIIKNYGPGAAYLVKFEILKDYDTLIKRKISEYQIFKNGLRYFAPNLEYSIPIIISSEDAPFELIIKITYYNCLNTSISGLDHALLSNRLLSYFSHQFSYFFAIKD